ncbi:hypothetical protein [Moorena bouillonii]|uniref:hypothetical protein n=1 Tax=Moorena bouillonii TaxID=207920 RepID=UPI0013010A7F|nr:hypothetical protein [Moorena bouillonii]
MPMTFLAHVIDWQNQQATCPEGHQTRTWLERLDNRLDTPIKTHRVYQIHMPLMVPYFSCVLAPSKLPGL